MLSKLVGWIGAVVVIPGVLVAQTSVTRPPASRTPARAAATTHPAAAAPTRYVLAPAGNEARYLVREELAGIDFPYDAVGKTSAITGAITLDAKGVVVPAGSHITVDVTTLKSDRANRDRYLKANGIESDKYPKVEFAVTALRGFPVKVPATGTFTFELIGNLTVRTVTKPVTWQVTATADSGAFSGIAKVAFKFGDFGMPVPSAFMVMKLEDNLRLEYDFHFVKETSAIKP